MGQIPSVSTPAVTGTSIPTQPNQNTVVTQTSIPTQPNQNSSSNQSANPITNSVTVNNSEENPESFIVNWSSSADPNIGYRIDIFDEHNNLIKSVVAENTERTAIITGTSRGSKSIIVYANNNGIFEKVSAPIKTVPGALTFTQRLLAMWHILIIPIGLIVGLVIWKLFFVKKAIPSTPPV